VTVNGLVGIGVRSQVLVLQGGTSLKLAHSLGCTLLTELAMAAGRVLIQSLGGKDGSLVVDRGRVVSLMNWHGSVHDVRLDNLLLDDGLDVVVDVVVSALASNDGGLGGRVRGLVGNAGVLELGSLTVQGVAGLVILSVVEGLVLDGHHIVVMLLGEGLLMSNGLDDGLMVVLVHLTVDSGGYVLMLMRLDGLLRDASMGFAVDGGLVLAITRDEVRNGGLCFLHVDVVWWCR